MLDLIVLAMCSAAIILLGLLIVSRNPSQSSNRRFAYLSAALAGWSVANYFSDHATSHVLLFTRLTLLGGVASIYAVILFLMGFPDRSPFEKSLFFRVHSVATIALVPIIFSKEFIKSVSLQTGSVNTASLYWLFISYVTYSLFLLPFIIRGQRRQAGSLVQKRQTAIIMWGIILYAIFATSSNVLLPALIGDWSSSRFGPAFTLFLDATVAYAVIRHRLFDIRLIVARSVAYTLTIVVAVALYGSIAFGVVAHLLFKGQHFSTSQQIVFSLLTVILVLAFPALQRVFNRATNRVFYRDAYDTQMFLDEFNKTLVSTYELKKLLQNASATIIGNLKSISCSFVISDDALGTIRVIGLNGYEAASDESPDLMKGVLKIKRQLLITDELNAGELKDTLRQYRIALVARLATAPSRGNGIGYLLLGPKKSGNLYTAQDINMVEIVANELAIAVENALRFEEIQNFNKTLQEKVEQATKELQRTNIRLRQLDETKDEFITMASHQLRTPLTSVKGYLSMVLEGDAGKLNVNQEKLLEQSYLSSQRMVYLISDLLNLSRLNTGKFVIEPSLVDLSEVAQIEVDQLAETAKARELNLVYNRPASFPKLMLDETKIHQVVMNFIDNAIYYTPSGGTVTVALRETPGTVEYTVTDTGIGVPKAVQHKLFTKFYRAGNAQQARPDGTGLGLFMAKKVVAAQGGAIIFESEEGKGSTFGFRFNKTDYAAPVIVDDARTLKGAKKKPARV